MKINWFKKQTESKKEEIVITSKEIQEDLYKSFQDILNEFDLKESKETEIENLKVKLKNFNKENKDIYNKIEILKNLGLSSTPTATKSLEKLRFQESKFRKKIEKIESEIKKVEKLKDLTLKYSVEYPFYKFIDDETMIRIMHKYDLVLGEAFMYSREIPYENLEIINIFSKKIKATEKTMQLVKTYHYFSSVQTYNFTEKITNNEKSEVLHSYSDMHIPNLITKSYNSHVVKEFTVSDFKMVAPESHFTVPIYGMEDIRTRKTVDVPLLTVNSDKKYKFTTEKVNEIEKKNREVLDPIACLEVEGGYIIMTAWDKEAEIPEIKSTFLN